MLEKYERYIIVFNDNRSLIGTLLNDHSGRVQLMDDDGIIHVIERTSVREYFDDGGPIDIVDGPDDGGPDDDDDDDDPDPSGGEALPVPTSSKLIDGEIAKAA